MLLQLLAEANGSREQCQTTRLNKKSGEKFLRFFYSLNASNRIDPDFLDKH